MQQTDLLNMADTLREFASALELCGNMPLGAFKGHVKTCVEVEARGLWSQYDGSDERLAEIMPLVDSLPWGFDEALDTLEEMPSHLRVMAEGLRRYTDSIYDSLK